MFEINYLDIKQEAKYEELVNNIINKCFKEENLDVTKIIINIILTNPENIKMMNKKYRNIDKETDVLSFPMFLKEEIEEKIINKQLEHEEVLGDIVISIERVIQQSEEYGHSFEREFCYMLVHGFYHLMGYDHIEEEDKKKMRKKEEIILNEI